MLPLNLLRVRTRQGSIAPVFCTQEEEINLAGQVVSEFEKAHRNREKKGALKSRISALESGHDSNNDSNSDHRRYNDYRLVRGLCALLERRCVFAARKSESVAAATSDPALLRRMLFEESSKRGFALTELERKEIVGTVAARVGASPEQVAAEMWSDLEENLVLEQFAAIDAKTLAGWYNLSLMQTLLFNCTKLDFYVSGGARWKRVLRNVKRLGLMYHLHYEDDGGGSGGGGKSAKLVCSLEGPLSLFKLTDRYGTSLAKLLPSIILTAAETTTATGGSNDRWGIDAWIVRKTMDGKKMYEFKISNNELPALLGEPPFPFHDDSGSSGGGREGNSAAGAPYFDSAVEEDFAKRFEQSSAAGAGGWRLSREPDPLVVSGGRAFIVDFMFEKYGGSRKVYLEVVGFWTKEYLERKMKKLADVVASATVKATTSDYDGGSYGGKGAVDLLVAIDEDLACSTSLYGSSKVPQQPLPSSSLSSLPKDRVIFYRNGKVPLKPVLDHLKSIDREMIEKHVGNPDIKIELDWTKDVISLAEVADMHDIPVEAVTRIIARDGAIAVADSGKREGGRREGHRHLRAGPYLISRGKAEKLESLLAAGVDRFSEACALFAANGIPEPCHAELLSELGYDVVWQSMDPDSAKVVARRKS